MIYHDYGTDRFRAKVIRMGYLQTTAQTIVETIDLKTVFHYFYKKRVFYVFYFVERFLFSSGKFFYPTKPAKILLNLLNSFIK